jgi:hypothetical protein
VVGRQIRDAQDTTDRSAQQVHALRDRLASQIEAATTQLETMDAQRQQLLLQ